MATFVGLTTEDDQILDLVKYVNKLQTKGKDSNETFTQECTKLIEDKKENGVVTKLIEEHNLVLLEGTDKDIEAYFFVLISLAKKYAPGSIEGMTTKFLNTLTSNTEDKPVLRFRLLNTIYNGTDKIAVRYQIYVALIKYSFATKNPDAIVRELNPDRFREYNLNQEQTRTLYKLIRDSLKESGRSVEAYNWAIKYLSTFESADQSQSQDAATTILDGIKLPSNFQFDNLLELALVKQLENSKEHGKLFQLLKIFVNENLDGFKAFVAGNSEYFRTLGLKEDECTYKMRLLSLASVGSTHQELTYAQIAKALHIEESEVESWVITGISEDILEAKMDQLRKVVHTSRCLQRVFTKSQWKHLSETLNVWRTNTQNILKTLQEEKQQFKNAAKSIKA